MKKIVSLLLAAMLCLACFTACAEGLDLTGVEATIPTAEIEAPELALIDAPMGLTTSDVVTMTSTYVQVISDGIKFRFDYVAAGDGYLIFTTDMRASMAAYARVQNPTGVQEFMLQHHYYMEILDSFTGADFIVHTSGADQLCAIVQDMRTLSNFELSQVAELYGVTEPFYYFNGTPWLHVNAQTYLTIVNGQYVLVQTPELVSADEFVAFMSYLFVSAQ